MGTMTIAPVGPVGEAVRNYLGSLLWDGEGRCDDWLCNYLGAERTDYTRAVAAKFLISCVARALCPGCRVESFLVLEGAPGIGKSRALGVLGGAWHRSFDHEGDRRAWAPALANGWIHEVSGPIGRRDDGLKAFMSNGTDVYRPLYTRTVATVPRASVFAVTTNRTEFGPDFGRRWWVVPCRGSLDAEQLAAARDQLWAEAVERFRVGEAWWWTDFADSVLPPAEEDGLRRWLVNRPEVTTREALAEVRPDLTVEAAAEIARQSLSACEPGSRHQQLVRWAEYLARLGLAALEIEAELWPAVEPWAIGRKEFNAAVWSGTWAGAVGRAERVATAGGR